MQNVVWVHLTPMHSLDKELNIIQDILPKLNINMLFNS